MNDHASVFAGSDVPLDASRDGEMASLLAMLSEQDAFGEPAFSPLLGTFANALLNGGHQAHCQRYLPRLGASMFEWMSNKPPPLAFL